MQQKIFNHIGYYLVLMAMWILSNFLLVFLQFESYCNSFGDTYLSYFNLIAGGMIMGVVWGTIHKVFRKYRNRIPSYGLIILTTSVVNVMSGWFMIFGVFVLLKLISNGMLSNGDLSELTGFYSDPRFFVILLYTFIVSAILYFVMDVNQKLGNGVLWNFIRGRYHKPREEERVFLFMDLKSSTHYAEKLGHLLYSKLLQDCFHDLTGVAVKNRAQIYQYVGDEVVLSWKIKSGIEHMHCIKVYFDFMDVLSRRSEYYRMRYGMVPVFKSGVNCGTVTVAEVGDLKREIAYHGDAINTASRIQGLCNSFDSQFLASEEVVRRLEIFTNPFWNVVSMGNVELKGKNHLVEVFEVKRREVA